MFYGDSKGGYWVSEAGITSSPRRFVNLFSVMWMQKLFLKGYIGSNKDLEIIETILCREKKTDLSPAESNPVFLKCILGAYGLLQRTMEEIDTFEATKSVASASALCHNADRSPDQSR